MVIFPSTAVANSELIVEINNIDNGKAFVSRVAGEGTPAWNMDADVRFTFGGSFNQTYPGAIYVTAVATRSTSPAELSFTAYYQRIIETPASSSSS